MSSEHNSDVPVLLFRKISSGYIWIDSISFHVKIVLMTKGQIALLRAVFLDAATESICSVAHES